MNAKASVAWLDVVFNHYLSMDPEVEGKVSAFDGKVIAVDVQGLDSRLYLLPSAGKIEVTDQYDAEPDTALKGAPSALFRMSLSDNVAPMMLRGEIEISGDVRLGREFKKLLSEIEIDWEDHLARLTGDVTANQLMKFGNNMASWIQRAVRSLEADVSEYLQGRKP